MEALRIAGNDEGGDALGAQSGIGLGEDNAVFCLHVGDPCLLAVEDPAAALNGSCGGADGGGIGTGSGFRQCKTDAMALTCQSEVLFLLLLCAVADKNVAAKAEAVQNQCGGGTALG